MQHLLDRRRPLAFAIAAVHLAGVAALTTGTVRPLGSEVVLAGGASGSGGARDVAAVDPALAAVAAAPAAPAEVVEVVAEGVPGGAARVDVTVEVPPAAEPPPEPSPEPPPPPAPEAPAPATSYDRAAAALAEAVPAAWRGALPVELSIVEGSTSYATGPDKLIIGRRHADGRWSHLLSVIGHEFGHLIAFRWGSQAYTGAAPAGWPDPNHGPPAEAWADCVAEAFTGIVDPSYGMPPCPADSLAWTQQWLGAGPPG